MIKYVKDDLFKNLTPKDNELFIVPHVCNNKLVWGSGFVIGLKNYFPGIHEQHCSMYKNVSPKLGSVDYYFRDQIIVANMVAQTLGESDRPLHYGALVQCMTDVKSVIMTHQSTQNVIPTIHCPKFGSFRAGGDWNIIEELIEFIWSNIKVNVYVL